MTSTNTKRIVLLGKTGAGKSSLGNTMFQEKLFTVNHSPNSETATCEAKTDSINGREITLIDLPGFFDTDKSEEVMKPAIMRCIVESSPGPHAFLIVLKVEKYTEQEKAIITKMCEYFSQEVFKYATVLFTHGDQLQEGQTIQDFVGVNDSLNEFVKRCSGGCHVIDNKYWNQNATGYRSNHYQVEKVLQTIDKIVQANKNCCYTNKLLQNVEEDIKEQEEKISKKLVNISTEQIREQAKANVYEKWTTAGLTLVSVLGAFLGVAFVVLKVR
ncbi:GTPase IMAP family member 7-like [Betta splendens]|uniref:GTPase IMAP family member 7-like n=1 Tax=Betta splendens TaxID=158456 RepID=A0A6P7P0T8_BETSP|nr:GTPase IMAP family member 7-like [Betta splendens]